MAKQLNVNLAFTADTSKAKMQLQDLQNQLRQLTLSTSSELGITKEIQGASRAAAELSVHLKEATNVQTGTLDFTKLNQSIKKSGTSLQEYGKTLVSMGPKGQQAFMSLAQAVATSEVPIRRTNAMLKEMGTTLANTARWQLSSSILHGFMGAVQSAYGYAQDLNESLNNIRIVTGQNIDEMAKFAQEANKAARALSATTTEYTNASLIYYQQGLNDQQVKERTDVTIKMANVARQSAEVVSDQMTAIWNNFYDGSKSLEHYADVMTALGAATASSTDEIAGGLEKFAAIGKTIGLSYEYAASALATITSNTRQSEEVVGTALKTIFARIQGLNLGETLEDGTSLNKYSKALETVGISIFNQQGELKKMDTILDEMGAKWDTLNKAQQVALAQTVAGVRQYNQLIALMDNWDKGDSDSFQTNLATANNSSGALQQQADIYAESWEAASDRVKAAAEAVYSSLINDEFFIDLLNSIEKVIGFVDHLIDNLGGLKGVLMAIGAIVTKVFSDQLAQGITNMAYNMQMATKAGQKKVQEQRSAAISDASAVLANMEGGSDTVQTTASTVYTEQLTLQQKMIDNADKMNDIEQKTVQMLMDQLKARGELAITQAKELDAAKEAQMNASGKLYTAAAGKANQAGKEFDTAAAAEQLKYIRESVKASRELDTVMQSVNSTQEISEQNAKDVLSVFEKLQKILTDSKGDSMIAPDDIAKVKQLLTAAQNADAEFEDLETTIAQIKGILGSIDTSVITSAASELGADISDVREYAEAVNNTATAEQNLNNTNNEVAESSNKVGEAIDNAKGKQQGWADTLVSCANFAFSAASALSMLGGMFDKLKDPDVSGWDKFLTILTTLGMVIPTLVSLFTAFKKILSTENVVKLANVAATLAQAAAEKKLNDEKGRSPKITKDNIKETIQDTKEKIKGKWKEKVSDPLKERRSKWDEGVWDKLDDKSKNKYIDDAMRKKGYTPNSKGTGWKMGSGKAAAKGAAKGGNMISNADAAKMVKPEAMKAAGGKAIGTTATGVGLIAAGVAVAVGAVAWGIHQFNKQAKAAEEAAAQAKKAAEAYQSVSQAYSEFTSTMDNYSNAKKGLEELTKGTLEYREAVLQANEAAMELINNNEGLQYTVDNDGLIQINEESMKAVQEKKLEQMQNAQISSQLAAQNAKTKQLESDKTDFARESLHSGAGIGAGVGNTLAATGAGAGAGALIGAGIGTIVPVIGNAVGAAVGAVVGGIAGLITGIVGSATAGASVDPEQQALEKLARVYEKEGNARFADDESFKAMLSEQGITDPLLIQSLTENRQSTMELVAKMAENTAAISSMNEQMVAQEFGDELAATFDKFYSSADDETAAAMTEAATESMAVQLEKRSAELYEDEYKDQFGGMTDADIQKQYAEAMGWDVDKTENKNGNKATYYDKDGNVVAEDLSDEVARQFLAQQAALKELEGSMPFYIDAVQSLANAGDSLGDGIGAAIASFGGGDGGNLSTLTQEQFAAAASADLTATKDKDGNVISFTYNGEVIDDEKAKLLGYESAAAFYDAFNTEIKRVENAWADIELDFQEAGLDPKIVEDLSLEAAQKFQKSLEKMNYGSLGDQGAKVYAEGIDMIASSVENMSGEVGMGEADVARFVEGLSDIDWSDWYAMDDVNALLESMGYDLDLTTEEMQEFIATMREVGGASPADALRRTWENAALLSDQLSKGIAPGSVLDKDTYAALIQENAALEDQFMQMMDGTYKYVGDDTLDFSNAMNLGETLEQTKEMSDLYENAKKAASEINFAGLANMDFVSSDEIEEASDALDQAAAAADKAQEEMDGFHPIKHKEYEAALNTANANEASAEQHLENLQEQRDSDLADAQAAVEAVMNNDYLKDVAEYNGWDEATLQSMLDGIAAGDDAAMNQMKTFANEMNKFMVAGDEGLYDVSAAEEKIASLATSIEELDELTAEYSLSNETYAKAITGLFASAANEAKDLEELDELKQKVLDAGGEVNNDVYLENVKRLTEESMNAASSIEELNKAKDEAQARGAEVDMELYANNVRRVAEESLGAANSLSELQSAWSEAAETGVQLDYSLYADNLLRLAESYSICADEAQAFQIAMQSGNEEAIKAAEENLEATVMLGEAAQQYGFEAEELSIQSKQLAKEYGLTAKEAAKLAIENQRMNKGVEALVGNWEEWGEELRKGNKTSRDWAKAAAATTKAIADLVGASEDLELPDDFFDSAHNLELIDQAAKGSVEAINELGVAVAAAQVQMMNFQEGMKNANGELIDMSQFTTWKDTVMSGITELQNSLDGIGMGDNVYEKLGGENWVAALNEMAIATGMSVEQMNSLLNSMGVQAEVEVKSVKQKMQVPTYTEVVEPNEVTVYGTDAAGNEIQETRHGWTKYTVPGPPKDVEGYVQVAQVKASENDVGSPEIKYTGNGNVSNSATKPSGGGGSSKKTSDARGKKSDMVDRYKQVDDKLDDTRKKMDDASKAADRLWGPSRLAQMRKVNNALKEEIGYLKDKKKEADKYLQEDKNALDSAASAAGVSFTYDANGNISNYEQQMTNLYNAREALLDSFGEKISESEQEKLDAFDAKADALKDAIAQYDETRELSEDLATEIQDKFYEWQDNNYEELNIELEYKLEVNDSKMEVIDYYMGKIEDDIYATAEAFGYLTQQSELYTDNLANQEQYVKDLTAKYEAGEISLQAYKEGLASSQSAIISNLQSLEESKQAMQDYYGNVMDMALEKISMYTDEMDHLNSVLDHYSSIMELVGKQDDYATKNKILRSKANNIQGELQVQKELYEKSAAEAQKWAEKMATATEGSNEYETYKKNWQAAQAAANDAQDAMLSKTEEWAEAMKSIIENELTEMADTLEKSLTGGVSFDELLTSMERRSSLQEEYLTTTNQIYETNKMMRTAQQEIDKTSNTVAKKKLQSFINETNQLQNQTKLSQYELDIQQAKYDLLLAEIALQEAQDAKSTVRLQRDAEGNFGYVYTADASQVADAEQKLADAQNNLYNIGLEGANDYQQKYAETLQESQDAITELTQMWINGEISDYDEYERRKLELTEYYGEKLKQYSELHTVALSTDSRVLTDAWSSDFIERTASVEEWKKGVDDYFEGAAGSMATWAEVTKTTLANSGLTDMDKALQEVDTKSNNLRKTLIGEDGKGGVVAAMMSEVETAGKVSDAHITIQNSIDKTIEKYEKLLTAVNNAHTAMDTKDNSDKNENNPNNNNNNNNNDNNNNNNNNENNDNNNENKTTMTWDRVYAAYKKINAGSWGNGLSKRISNGAAEGYTEEEVRKAQELINKVYGGSTLAAAKSALGFDTGGYTGDWAGSYGKLAMLHKKELVLKEGDTENFLASMELLERILSIIDLQSANAQLGGTLSSPSYGNHATETIVEQNVHIEASFPGVSDRNELQEAFTNLINQASQYANRK